MIGRQPVPHTNCAMRKISLLFIILLAIVPATCAADVREISVYVSNSGRDSNPGTKDRPIPSNSRAASAGLRVGDVILKIAGKPTDSLAMFQQITAALPATGRVRITIWRQQKEATVEVEAPVR